MNMPRIMRMLAVVGIFAATCAQAATQIGDRLNLSVAAYAQYTDNRDSSPSGEESTTWDLVASPTIDTVFNLQRTFIELMYMPSYRHRTNPAPSHNENQWLHDLLFKVNHESGRRLSLRFEERFNYTDDPEIVTGEQIERTDRSFIFNRLMLGANIAMARRSNLDLEGSQYIKRYQKSEVANVADEDRYTLQARLMRQHSQSIGYSLLGRYLSVQREDSLDLRRDLQAYYLGGGLRAVFSKYLVGELDAGYQRVEYDEPTVSAASTPFAEARLSYNPTVRTGMYFGGVYSATEAFSFPFISQDLRYVYGGLDWRASRTIDCGLHGEYRIEQYEADKVDPNTPLGVYQKEREGDENTVLLSVWVSVRLRHGLTARVRHYFEDVDSDVSTSFTRNATRISLSKEL